MNILAIIAKSISPRASAPNPHIKYNATYNTSRHDTVQDHAIQYNTIQPTQYAIQSDTTQNVVYTLVKHTFYKLTYGRHTRRQDVITRYGL